MIKNVLNSVINLRKIRNWINIEIIWQSSLCYVMKGIYEEMESLQE